MQRANGGVIRSSERDVTQLLPLIDAIPPLQGERGRPCSRPARAQADRAYHSGPHEAAPKTRNIQPVIAHRGMEHGSGLGKTRWVVERTTSWLHQFKRLRVRCKRRADTHETFLALGCILICCRIVVRVF